MTTYKPVRHIVLYADDDQDDLELVREAFNQHSRNVQLVTLSDGFEVLSFLKNMSPADPVPCLIILDINMPRLNGKETLVQLRNMESFKNVPIILFTTSSQMVDKAFAQKHKAGFITKPIDVSQLNIIASTFIDHCAQEVQKNISRQIL